MNDAFSRKGAVIERVLALCARLRAEDGCAWDREQTLATLTPYLLEETHEVLDAVAQGNREAITEELGDLLFVTVFALHAAETEGVASLESVVDGVVAKLVRRHPHVFGESPGGDRDHARESWQKAKRSEAAGDAPGGASALGPADRSQPALLAAYRLQEKAAAVGFDWNDVEGPLDKIAEELAELREVLADRGAAEREIGDLYFAATNVARRLHLDPEVALRGANQRFRARFRFIETELAREGLHPEDVSLERLEALWQLAKKAEPPA